jgi:hypothetical protein
MRGDRNHLKPLAIGRHPVDDAPLRPQSGSAMVSPHSGDGFVVEAPDHRFGRGAPLGTRVAP